MAHSISHSIIPIVLFASIASFAQNSSLGTNNLLNGQGTGDTLRLDLDKSLSEQLIPFEAICDIAYRNSPALQLEDASIVGKMEVLKFTKYSIFDGVKPFATFLDGNQTLYLASGNFIGDNFQLTTGYRYGITAEIPLSELFGRKHKLRAAQSEYIAAQSKRRMAEREVKRQLIDVYQDLIMNQRILTNQIKDEQAQLTALRIAEVELQQGKISPEIFSRLSGAYTSSNNAVETARGAFLKSFYLLEVIAGVPMQQLKKSQ